MKYSTLASGSTGSRNAKPRSGLMSMSERSTAAKPRLEASMPIPSVTVFSVKFAAGIVTLRNRPSMSDTKKATNSIPSLSTNRRTAATSSNFSILFLPRIGLRLWGYSQQIESPAYGRMWLISRGRSFSCLNENWLTADYNDRVVARSCKPSGLASN